MAGFAIFVMQAFPYIPMRSEEPWGISAYHKPNAFIIIGFCVLTFYKACFTGKMMYMVGAWGLGLRVWVLAFYRAFLIVLNDV